MSATSTAPATLATIPFFVKLWSDEFEESKDFFLHATDEMNAVAQAVSCADEQTLPEETRWYVLRVIPTANL